MDNVIQSVRKTIPDHKLRVKLYKKLIGNFESHDCDTLCECLEQDYAYDEAYRSIYLDEEEE